MSEETYHIPALLSETIVGLKIKPDGVYVDATFGGGGHSRAILGALGSEGHLLGFDRDLDAMENAPQDDRFTFVHSDFRFIPNFLRYHGIEKVDGILADLGVSFHHFDSAERGFSFRQDSPLDMRMNQLASRTAADIVQESDAETLTSLFRAYTDLKNIKGIVNGILKRRAVSPIVTTFDLTEAVRGAINPRQEKKDLAQVFQALRIEVNGEMDALQALLRNSLKTLRPGGRLAVITYHSIEDRMVKNFIRSGNIDGKIEKDFYGNVETPWITIKPSPIMPSAEEQERNPRSRSAKLRIAELR
jgi:16S rRNA (cytosine1402-N4)-methyltransferase